MSKESIIVYRNPIEAMLWENLGVLGIFVAVSVLGCWLTFSLADKLCKHLIRRQCNKTGKHFLQPWEEKAITERWFGIAAVVAIAIGAAAAACYKILLG